MVVGRSIPEFQGDALLPQGHSVPPVEIPDPNMTCVFAHAVRGGQSLISKRYSKADTNTKIIYLDANNLYGFSMSGKLPVDDFRWEVEVLIQQAQAESLKYWRSWTRVDAAAL